MGFNEILQSHGVVPKVETKVCGKCHQAKPLEEFSKNATQSHGREIYCKLCRRVYRQHQKARQKVHVKEKRCGKCREVKGRERFSKDASTRDGLRSQCKECASLSHRHWAAHQAVNAPTEKRCRKCGIVKPREEFHRDPKHLDGLRSYCIQCRRLLSAADYALRSSRQFAVAAGPSLGTWEQVEQAVKQISELQKIINHERSACLKIVQSVKTDLAAKVTRLLLRQVDLEGLIERFIKKNRRNGDRIERVCAHGRISFFKGRLDVIPNLPTRLVVER
ncbi:MAG TPA: hypothetical protein VMW16_03660 [Sedimentisphaerales bacterium]|nr:hypothetical protein [Sedimentisphaerales bacterium]